MAGRPTTTDILLRSSMGQDSAVKPERTWKSRVTTTHRENGYISKVFSIRGPAMTDCRVKTLPQTHNSDVSVPKNSFAIKLRKCNIQIRFI